jgi:hypothetical protein
MIDAIMALIQAPFVIFMAGLFIGAVAVVAITKQ